MAAAQPTIHEVDFCSQIASEANMLIRQNPTAYPFSEARVEGYGEGPGRRKRKDLRFFGRNGKLVLCGEVKLPGTPEGRSPFDRQAHAKMLQRRPAMPASAISSLGTSTSSRYSTGGFGTGRCLSGVCGSGAWAGRSPIPPRWPAKTTSTSSRRISCPTCCATWPTFFPGVGASGCPRTTSSSAPWKATWIGPSSCASAYILEQAEQEQAL